MIGFFTKKETQSESKHKGKVLSCASCGLYRDCLHPRMEPVDGELGVRIVNIGEAPTAADDSKGGQWQEQTGRLLKRTYEKLGIDLMDCTNTNAVNCRPIHGASGKTRTPTKFETACCRKRVLQAIKEAQPKVIILLGTPALWSLLATRWKEDPGGMDLWRGWTIPAYDLGAWLCPVFHPNYIVRQPDLPQVETIWRQDLERAFGMLDVPLPEEPTTKQVHILHDPDDIQARLQGFSGRVTFDYETTGLKPHGQEHAIKCVSFAQDGHSWVFALEGVQVVGAVKKTLSRADLGKVAHNMRFEQSWSLNKLQVQVNPWVWDTQAAAHLLDNRPGVSGLKFQAFVNFGVAGYDTDVAPYLRSPDGEGANALNRIDKLWATEGGRRKVLEYCGMDSLLEDMLQVKQRRELGYE